LADSYDLFDPASKLDLKQWQIRTNLEHERNSGATTGDHWRRAALDQVLLTHAAGLRETVKKASCFRGSDRKGAVVENSNLFF